MYEGQERDSESKGNTWTDDSYFVWECGYCGKWGHKKAQCRKLKKDQGVKPPAATVQAVATVNQFHSSDGRDDSFWMFAVSASSGRNVRVLVDSGADKHVCPMSFASATPLGPAQGWHALCKLSKADRSVTLDVVKKASLGGRQSLHND